MKRDRRTKIVATLGPASADSAMIDKLFHAGVDMFRLNFSHGAKEGHAACAGTIRELQGRTGRPIAILADLQGPKLRVGKFDGDGVNLTAGQTFTLDQDPTPGTSERVQLPHPEIFSAVGPGDSLLVDDGRLRLEIKEKTDDVLMTTVISGSKISNNKGGNVPGVALPISALTEKDRQDLDAALEIGVDWVALSFVQRPEDVTELKDLVAGRAAVMVKLEKPAAMAELDAIVDVTGAVMVARGDLGVELPPEDVPTLQKKIVRTCRHAGKPVVVATQMLESMVQAPVPTHAEATDVANAVYEGADAVMLSAESAVGDYPIEAVTMMDRIIKRVEADPRYGTLLDAESSPPEDSEADAITACARLAARTVETAAIVTYTTSGSTALRMARIRPQAPILAMTPSQTTARRLALVWGLHAITTDDATTVTEIVNQA
ncbi:MAG: pyruvate kinase, partial [Geminicoccaceae bacterium]